MKTKEIEALVHYFTNCKFKPTKEGNMHFHEKRALVSSQAHFETPAQNSSKNSWEPSRSGGFSTNVGNKWAKKGARL